jgi:hypothetical protein
MADVVNISIDDGTLSFIYTDDLKSLLSEGKSTARRVSHVEPVPSGDDFVWTADMSPVDGPELGPFTTRQEALDAEVDWLRSYRGL